jgi:hypothetical protein
MHELARVSLQNEMDLVLAHRRSMKLGELAELSLSAQTTFATAVSEVARTSIGAGNDGCLVLCVMNDGKENYIIASVKDSGLKKEKVDAGLEYAKRLVHKYSVSSSDSETKVDLYFCIPSDIKLDITRLDAWRRQFRNEPPISAYDELKRKNEQLQELAGQLKESEAQYKMLTNTLPLIIFSLDTKSQVIYNNEWMAQYTGLSSNQLNQTQWKSVVHPEDYISFMNYLKGQDPSTGMQLKIQARLKHAASGHYLWHMISLTPLKDEKDALVNWSGFMADINVQKVFEETLQDNKQLKAVQNQLLIKEQSLNENIQELNRSNIELQQFAYIASHDLQEPVRKLIFYSDYLLQRHEKEFDEKSVGFLRNMIRTSNRMRTLIRDLLTFSQVNQNDRQFSAVNLNQLFHEALQDLELSIKAKDAQISVTSLALIEGDAMLLRQLFVNVLSNSIKYSKEDVKPLITVTHEVKGERIEIYFKDNGIGFEEKYIDKIFMLFQRLHARDSYVGTGLGLAICRKIAEAHHGTIIAESQLGAGATFILSLPFKQPVSNHIHETS